MFITSRCIFPKASGPMFRRSSTSDWRENSLRWVHSSFTIHLCTLGSQRPQLKIRIIWKYSEAFLVCLHQREILISISTFAQRIKARFLFILCRLIGKRLRSAIMNWRRIRQIIKWNNNARIKSMSLSTIITTSDFSPPLDPSDGNSNSHLSLRRLLRVDTIDPTEKLREEEIPTGTLSKCS